MADTAVMAWAKRYADQHSIQKLADLVGYKRTSLSLYLSDKYPADPKGIELELRRHMSSRMCPYLEMEIMADDCARRAARPRPHQSGSAMEEHWMACQNCSNKGVSHE